MKNNIYSETVLRHFKKPHNFGKMENPDGIGKVGNLICGDVMHIYIKVQKDVIKDIKFEAFGCVAALATSSAVTDLAKGKSLEQALKINRQDIVDVLGGLPPIKIHCSVLAIEALGEAVYDYLKKNKKKIPPDLKKRHDKVKRELDIIEKRYKALKK